MSSQSPAPKLVPAAEQDAIALLTAAAVDDPYLLALVARQVSEADPARRILAGYLLIERALSDGHVPRHAAAYGTPARAAVARFSQGDPDALRNLLAVHVGPNVQPAEVQAFLGELALEALACLPDGQARGILRQWGLSVATTSWSNRSSS